MVLAQGETDRIMVTRLNEIEGPGSESAGGNEARRLHSSPRADAARRKTQSHYIMMQEACQLARKPGKTICQQENLVIRCGYAHSMALPSG